MRRPAEDGDGPEDSGGQVERGPLSVTVVRKAGEIEQLAHKVRTGSGKN